MNDREWLSGSRGVVGGTGAPPASAWDPPSIPVPEAGEAGRWMAHLDSGKDEGKEQAIEARQCDACNAVVATTRDDMAPWLGIWFCGRCTRVLPTEEIERLASEIALRGVPWS